MAPRTYLDEIVAAHRTAAAHDGRDIGTLRAEALAQPPARGLRRALQGAAARGLAVIAEIKRRSPSKGALDPGLDPGAVAREYEQGGAAAVSVLTDDASFGGSPADLAAARGACALPVLRKDFTVAPADVYDARIMGADGVLLIVAALSAAELRAFHDLAGEVGLDALVEVHDEAELELALTIGATLIGVNQRDLVTFEVDHDRAARLAGRIPAGVVAVAESGVRDGADAARLAEAGYDAVLVGETLMRAGDRIAALSTLRGAPVRSRRAAAPTAGR